ncbi:tyrosine-type recombinase/integrase [Billgrantia lactosivorans]|uniref:tyrosine-type recombinase/integrase n=1 Tax=Billgrantia lactosivorans TaxID=2185141 RepID=UPI000DACABB0|nr:integrase arm-type DNA-binding domain-containing protein [Halomonas lactosivorans]
MKLTATAIKQAKPAQRDYKMSDGKSLYLLVKKNGSKYWRLKYRSLGKEKLLALGVYPEVSLAEARRVASESRELIRQGIDPLEYRKQRQQQNVDNARNSFKAIAHEWWSHEQGRWEKGHAQRVWKSLEVDMFPYIGNKPITAITPPEVLAAIRKVEARGALDVAGRVLQRTSAVFRFAVQTSRASVNPAAELKGVLTKRRVQHRPALPRDELPEFLKQLDEYHGHPVTRLALKLLVLTFVRSGELRGARWDEFDLANRLWRIPGERMKMSVEHLVPLSPQAINVLRELNAITGQYDLVFPSDRNRHKSMSENTLLYAMYRMGYRSRATPHGFRAVASSILNEAGFNPDAIERQLAHIERDQVRGAYTHLAKYMDERKHMMDWYSDHLDQLQAGTANVVPLRKNVV